MGALAQLREVGLVYPDDPQNPGAVDCHPLVREFFDARFRHRDPDAWRRAHLELFRFFQSLGVPDATRFQDLEPFFTAIVHGCKAGLMRDALHDLYRKVITRGDQFFATRMFGAFSQT